MATSGKREIQAIAILLSIGVFLGISDKTTLFIFPQFGEEVFTLINFYLLTTVTLIVIVIWLAQNHNIPALPQIPSLWAVLLNFGIFFIPSYLAISWIISGSASIIPTFPLRNFIEQGLIASFENLVALILLPVIFPWGNGAGNLLSSPITIFSLKNYTLRFNPPNWNRFKYGIPAIIFITLLHSGAYSYQVATFSQFYIALVIAGVMFALLWGIKESYGFGACIAVHLSWNLILISIRGAIY